MDGNIGNILMCLPSYLDSEFTILIVERNPCEALQMKFQPTSRVYFRPVFILMLEKEFFHYFCRVNMTSTYSTYQKESSSDQ